MRIENLQKGVLCDFLARKGLKAVDFGAEIGVTERVGLMRLNTPDNLKVREVRRIQKWLTDDEIVRLIRGEMPKRQAVNVFINRETLKKVAQSL